MENYQPALTEPSRRSSVSEVAKLWGQAASRDDAGPMLLADVRAGGRFRDRFHMLDGSEHKSNGEYREIVGHSRPAMTWLWLGGDEDPEKSYIT
jgi:uncharacterized protein YndB with AHSA1/START domain